MVPTMIIGGWTHSGGCQCRPCYAERQQAVVPEIPELHPEVARGATTARIVLKRMPLREHLGRWILWRLGVGF